MHVASSKENNFHSLCKDSWCQYQRDLRNGTNLFQHGPGLAKDVIAEVKPIYQSLVNPVELEKCLHGKTQNQNESFNGTIWERAPKGIYLSYEKLCYSVYDTVSCFNDGRICTIRTLQNVGITAGYYTTEFCSTIDMRRKQRAIHKWEDSSKKRCKVLRANRKKRVDVNEKKVGKTYHPGGF